MSDPTRLPASCLVVLVGPSAAGKSTWAAEHFPASAIVSSDALRAVVGENEGDMEASEDAFAVLDEVVQRRLSRKLLTVIDTLGLNDERRLGYLELARHHGLPAYAVGFDTPAKLCRERNRSASHRVPVKVLDGQLRNWRRVRDLLDDEGWDGVLRPVGQVEVIAEQFLETAPAAVTQATDPVGLRFGLQLSTFDWGGDNDEIAQRIGGVATAAEQAGFDSLWVMDHLIQIPQVGREWDPILESYVTLGYLAAHTNRMRLGAMVTAVTFRNVALLGKMVASLDVLSGGRMVCGLGAGWFEREHNAYELDYPSAGERLDLLEDALQALPLMWGPGSKAFNGKRISVPDTICYPRPLQDPLPLLVGGQGERRTLRLVAEYADACNLFGDADTVRHKLEVLARHCADVERDPAEVEVTHLAPALVGSDRNDLEELIARHKPPRTSTAGYVAAVNAGTVDDHIGRFRTLADAGVDTAIVPFPPVATVAAIERFSPVIAAFK